MAAEVHKTPDTGTASCAREVLAAVADVLDRLGIDGQSILSEAGISTNFPALPGRRVPLSASRHAWNAASASAGRSDLGLLVGQAVSVTTFGPLGYALCACHSLGEALELLSRFVFIIDDELRISLVHTDTAIHANLAIPEARTPANQLAYIILVFRFCRLVTENCPLLEAELPAQHANLADECRAIFNVEPKFTGRTSFVFDAATAGQSLPDFDPAALCQARATLDDYVSLGRGQSFTQRITRTLEERLKDRTYSLAEIARSFNMSQRSLQRNLHNENVTFRGLLSATRHRLALNLLIQPDLTVTRVSFLLGFADVSSFSHAFRRWTGENPEAFRRRSLP